MLKKILEEELKILKDRLHDRDYTIQEQKKQLGELRDRKSEYRKLENHVDDARTVINALLEINCAPEINWMEIRYNVFEQCDREGKDHPEPPPVTDLYKSLNHIFSILGRPVTEPKEDTQYRFR